MSGARENAGCRVEWAKTGHKGLVIAFISVDFQTQSSSFGCQPTVFPVDRLLTELITRYQEIGEGEVTLHLPLQPLPPLRADYSLTLKALEHLIDNALKFKSPEQKAEVTIITLAVNNELHVRVQDRGIGLTGEQLQYIFDPFYQADTSSTQAYSGTGVGLKIVQLIAEKHGGRIEVESQTGQGSTFS